jgi:hypothetical protein
MKNQIYRGGGLRLTVIRRAGVEGRQRRRGARGQQAGSDGDMGGGG